MAPRKRKATRKVRPPKEVQEQVYERIPFHILFPIMLTHKEGKSTKYCYFQVKEHLDKYIKRLKLKKNEYKIENTPPRDEEEI